MKIMVPVDSSEYSDRGVEIAGQYVEKFPSEVFLVNVQPDLSRRVIPLARAPLPYSDNKQLIDNADSILDEAEKIIIDELK